MTDASLKRRTLDWAFSSGEVKVQDVAYPVAAVAINSAGATQAWEYFKENFDYIADEILALCSSSVMDAVIISTVGHFCKNESADEVESFFSNHPLPLSKHCIHQSVQKIRVQAKMTNTIRQSSLASPTYWA